MPSVVMDEVVYVSTTFGILDDVLFKKSPVPENYQTKQNVNQFDDILFG